jgi:transcription elongation factor GreB
MTYFLFNYIGNMNKKKNYITPGGLEKLLSEHEQLQKVERPETVKVVTWAASLGDRSENADYKYGKKRLREIDSRLRFLTKRIDAAEAVDPSKIESCKVQFGATVTVEDEDSEIKTYAIVGIDETDSAKSYISWKSPIGSALIGKEIGDTIEIRVPKGNIELEILEIKYQKLNTGSKT